MTARKNPHDTRTPYEKRCDTIAARKLQAQQLPKDVTALDNDPKAKGRRTSSQRVTQEKELPLDSEAGPIPPANRKRGMSMSTQDSSGPTKRTKEAGLPKPSRRLPPAINSDDNEDSNANDMVIDNEPQLPPQTRVKAFPPPQSQHTQDLEDDDSNLPEHSEGELDYDDGAEDLRFMNPKLLQRTMLDEVSFIKPQTHEVKQVLRAAIDQATYEFLFVAAYHPSEDLFSYQQALIVKCAVKLRLDVLADRLKNDVTMVDEIARLINSRLTLVRGGIKKIVGAKVEGYFSLAVSAQSCKDRVAELVHDLSYIYPIKNDDIVEGKPYQHPILIATLKESFFASGRKSLGDKYALKFLSSITDGEASKEPEIPLPMIAFVATALHSALDDWFSGECKKTSFNADAYEDIYNSHVSLLDDIRKQKVKYHRMASNLYKSAMYDCLCLPLYTKTDLMLARSNAASRSINMAKNATARLNLDAMSD
ncbi:hypothetical protein H0H81_001866 [Sphagnurus paluster]|uniref:DUF6532 domain-containing protein n=1 Tax=Sphagnurus paluster TaxID=117069 RepID=A0A9P7K6G5_9AGAR|nr:hypothetical protein H0H81_001866 [Sphagnurus paluster]